jgi:CheY-like chemotaxis protein
MLNSLNPPKREGMVLQLADGSIEACNANTEMILGLKLEQIEGWTSINSRWQTIDRDGEQSLCETHPAMVALTTGKPCLNIVMGFYKPNGELIRLLLDSQPLFKVNETNPYAVVTTFSDIEDRQQVLSAGFQQHITKPIEPHTLAAAIASLVGK